MPNLLDIFYYFGIVVIIYRLRIIYYSKSAFQQLQETTLNDVIKSVVPSLTFWGIIGYLEVIWLVAGMFISETKILFVGLFFYEAVSQVMKFSLRKKIIIGVDILSILIFVLYTGIIICEYFFNLI